MMPHLLPVLYLNPLEHHGKMFIKCWHKTHSFISQKLKAAPWIAFSRTYKCYVMHHTPQAITQTQQYFSGVATVSTRYLYRPKRLQPAAGTTILAHKQAPVLLKRVKRPIIHLAPFMIGDSSAVSITFKYSPLIENRLRSMLFVKWQPSANCFTMATDSHSLHTLIDQLADIAQLWISQNLEIKDITLLAKLWEQNYEKRERYISCPLAYLEKLFLLNYSRNTVRTYHNLLLRFLNQHANLGLNNIQTFTEEQINQYHRQMVQSSTYS